MTFEELQQAGRDARRILDQGDCVTRDLVEMLVGRLRFARVPTHVLDALKRELRGFHLGRQRWMPPR